MGKTQSTITSENLADLTRTTYFEKKEIDQWYQGFISEIPRGYLTAHDLNKLYEQYFPFGDTTTFTTLLFNLFDEDKDGRVMFDDYLRSLSIIARGKFAEKLVWSFRFYDIDNDGYISREELLLATNAIYKMIENIATHPEDEDTPAKRVDKLFSLMDTNKDGKIDLDEYCIGVKSDPFMIQSLFLYDGHI
ncbi:Neuronal calcium sensor 1 [Mitosporidium daphniae]